MEFEGLELNVFQSDEPEPVQPKKKPGRYKAAFFQKKQPNQKEHSRQVLKKEPFHPRTFTKNPQNTPQNTQNTPQNTQNTPQNTQNTPQNTPQNTQNTQNTPQNTQNENQNAGGESGQPPAKPRKRSSQQAEDEPPSKRPKRVRAPLSALTKKVISYEDILKLAAKRNAEGEGTKGSEAGVGVFDQNVTFEDLCISPRLIKALNEKLQHTKPTSIQAKAIPAIMSNANVLVKAETGSGKTLTYLIPIVSRLLELETVDRTQGSYALVIAPTRELVLQIYEVLSLLVKQFPWIVVGNIMGGEKKKSEKSRIRKGITILIATPGRLLDHLQNTSAFQLGFLKWLVFDEADRLLDLGFEKEITQIMKLLNERAMNEENGINTINRQTLLLSATLSKALSNLAYMNLDNPVFIGLDNSVPESGDDDKNYNIHKIPDTLNQFYIMVPMKKKLILLATFLRWKLQEEKDCKMIVFFSNCDSVEYFFTLFSAIQLPTQPPHLVKKNKEEYEPLLPSQLFKLHGNMAQNTRTPTFLTFRNSNSAVLFCTDVAARGLDLPHVNWIIQYDPPSDPRAYIHRVGRTARIGQSGNAVVFVTPQEESYIKVLNSKDMVLEEIPFLKVVSHLKANFEKNLQKDPEIEMGSLQFRFQYVVQKPDNDVDLKSLAVVAFQSFVRSYATHTKSTRHIFDMKNLHLGHLAKSFALKEPPSSFLQTQKPSKKKKNNQKKRVTAFSASSEFADGLME